MFSRVLARGERGTLLALIALAGLSWLAILYQWQAMGCRMCGSMSVGCPMCMGTGKAFWLVLPSFLAMWSSMMAAMMLPAVTPMVLLFARFSRTRNPEDADAFKWIFASGYLLAWALTGLAAFAAVRLIQALLVAHPELSTYGDPAAGVVLVAAGLYQWSPFKDRCLEHCRSPLEFLAEHWREGTWGALRTGFWHALYCIGCCWGIMLVMFGVGLMNLAWMVALTVVMSAEKMIPRGALVGRLAGAAFLAFGLFYAIRFFTA
jgi:predicted metal-binding membrane protein